jgi:hypothetical protein
MARSKRFPGNDDLLSRQSIEIELPRFLVRIFEQEIAKTNEGSTDADAITLNDYIEYHLAEFVSLADVLDLERQVPGISAAVWKWLDSSHC